MYKFLTQKEASAYYSKYYPKILAYWQKHGHELRPMLLKKLNIKNKCILDIACGDGSILKDLVKNNEVYGIDISESLLRKARKNRVKTALHDLDENNDLPYPDLFFDVSLMLEIVEHLFHPKILFKKCSKVLKKNGKIYMTMPNHAYPGRLETIQKSLESALNHVYKEKIPEKAKRFVDINIMNISKLKKILSDTGFQIKKIHGWNWRIEDLSARKIN
ncbi:MAG: class I SAM-dependent methyltransferase, partial [Nanoarchaeota archaeon]|nr:class I SAM-dependent methyltransferase [Nanoarchaeota archaeon]